ncbi:MAG TPA: hypothetical protein P5572_20410 [Phycisphaerae bacterium]|nr:hypothetical protein [Phycisphaerales bacterium]HRX87396.1 hypothetical protein [Phycisphaerae bacterium]
MFAKRDYDEGAVLTELVVGHYWRFLTEFEKRVVSAWRIRRKWTGVDERRIHLYDLRHNLHSQPDVQSALTDPEAFLTCVRKRILRDHTNEVHINRCPECQRVLRTPQAQQCPWCGYDWHAAEQNRD